MNSPISETMFVGGGEMGAMMRSHNWSQTALGPVETWPQSLLSALSICLNSRFPIAIYWGADCLLLYNDAWRPIVGDKHSWALGHPAREVWSEIWDDIGPELAGVLATGEGTFHKDDLLSMRRFGYTEECFFEYTFNPIQGAGGVVDGVLNIVSETTYRVLNDRRAQLLREVASKTGIARTSEDACSLMVEAFRSDPLDIPLALLYLIDAEGKHAYRCQGTMAEDMDSALKQRVNPASVALMTDDPAGWPIALVTQTTQPQEVYDLVSRFGALPGSPWAEPPQEAMVLPIIPPGQGKVSGVLVVVASPRRRLDDPYRDFFTQLAGQVAVAIANAQAYEAERKRAEALAEIDQAKTVFFSNVSHEFRTPLTLMLSPLEELLQGLSERLRPEEREQLHLMQRNGLRLQKLVNTLLDFSRIEAGRIRASYELTDLAAYTAELASTFRSLVERAGMTLLIECPPLPELVYVDREMWEKIVLNLLSNAFKFTLSGSITVQLQTVGDTVELSVQDTGVGIPAAELPRLFERFHRVTGTRSRTYEGSGIGLSLVQELVRLHQGAIAVTSVEGEGTRFTVSIPTGTTHLPQDQISTPRTLASTGVGGNAYLEEALRWLPTASLTGDRLTGDRFVNVTDQGLVDSAQSLEYSHLSMTSSIQKLTARIVLVDDNADMRDYVKRLLVQQYEVEAVGDGRAALATIEAMSARHQTPDLVLTDVMMPELDGFGLLQALRTHPQTREIPIILLSARAGEEARIEGLVAGADDYLIKPFSARELLARVEATLKLAQLRREAGAALRESEEKYRTLFESIDQGFCIVELIFDESNHPVDYRFLITNPAFVKHTDQPDAQGKTAREIAPNHEAYWFETYGKVALTGESVRFENWAEEFQRWYEVYAFRVGEPELNRVGILFQDVSDRKRNELNEQFLSQLDQRLRQLSDADEMAWEAVSCLGEYLQVDRCFWHEVDWARQATTIHRNWRRKDLPDLAGVYTVTEYVTPTQVCRLIAGHPLITNDVTADPEIAPDRAQNLLALGIRTFVSIPCIQSKRWVALLSVNAEQPRNWRPDEVELLQEMVARLWSLIEHTRAVEELRQSEAEFRQLANAMPQIVWVSDGDGRNTFVNDRWTEYTGMTVEQASDLSQTDLIPAEDVQKLQADFAIAIQNKSSYTSEFRILRPDGSYRYFLARATPTQDEQGRLLKWYGTSTDITELKQLEIERAELLRQEQAAREAAEQANRIKDEFLAVLSHELRSPLNPILGWAKLLQTGKLNATKTTQAIATIERNAQLQAELIEDLLDVSRILQGKLSLSVRPVDLSAVVRSAIETVRLSAEAKSIDLRLTDLRLTDLRLTTLDFGVESPYPAPSNISNPKLLVSGDATRLQQVVWNLLSNAVKFTPAGGAVEIRLERSSSFAEITVIDTGKGIDPKFLPHVFDYFRQEDGATTRKFGGLGLGLAIVRHLVELHGGTVQAQSQGEGQGATFTVKLPLRIEGGRTRDETSPPAAPLILRPLKDLRVLVIDDEVDSRDFAAFVLQQAGATVITAPTASEGFLALTQSPPDVLLSDIGMPDMDGYMLMRQVRALSPEQGGRVQAIALTAYATEIDQQKALQAGFQAHLTKPIEPETLIGSILNALQQGQS